MVSESVSFCTSQVEDNNHLSVLIVEERIRLCGYVQNVDVHLRIRINHIIVAVYLVQVRKAIHEAIPEAEEKISWGMPTFWKQHNIIYFAANKKHIGIYAGIQAVIEFAEQLSSYKTSKGTIQIPYEEPMPLELIAQIALWCYETDNHP